MSEANKSKGQALVERIAGWLGGYMFFQDPAVGIVLALWVLHTWVFERFDATPYLVVTAATKQAGKTRLMELLAMLSQNGKMFGDMTPAAYFRMMEAYNSKLTIFFDEAEKLSSSAAGVMRSVMNTGYRQGQTITRAKSGGGVEEFPVFGPKCFALIGDVNDTLRDRSVVVTLMRGKPAREFSHAVAQGEAAKLKEEMFKAFEGGWPSASPQAWLSGRDKEIWAGLFGVADALKLDKGMRDELTRCAADLVAGKTAEARRYFELAVSEDDARDAQYGERAIRDLASVIGEGEKAITSAVAVERLKAIPTGPWRMFRGSGLTEVTLAALVSRFGVHPKLVRLGTKNAGKGQAVKRGYSASDVRASLPKD